MPLRQPRARNRKHAIISCRRLSHRLLYYRWIVEQPEVLFEEFGDDGTTAVAVALIPAAVRIRLVPIVVDRGETFREAKLLQYDLEILVETP